MNTETDVIRWEIYWWRNNFYSWNNFAVGKSLSGYSKLETDWHARDAGINRTRSSNKEYFVSYGVWMELSTQVWNWNVNNITYSWSKINIIWSFCDMETISIHWPTFKWDIRNLYFVYQVEYKIKVGVLCFL